MVAPSRQSINGTSCVVPRQRVGLPIRLILQNPLSTQVSEIGWSTFSLFDLENGICIDTSRPKFVQIPAIQAAQFVDSA